MPLKAPLQAGDKAPAFTAIDQDGAKVTLKQLLAEGEQLILYFYPKDDTPGCTKEACDFRDLLPGLKKKGVTVVGVSPDSAESHVKFRTKYKLPFRLLSDPEHKIAEAYGAWGEKKNYGKVYVGLIRSTFVIGAGGKIIEAMNNVKATGHAAKVAERLG